MKLRSIFILLLVSLAAMLSAQATNLIISEYVEGTSYNKALEIFNGTGAPVDLSTVSLKKQTNGVGAFGNELVLSGTLADNDVFVIVNSTSSGTNLSGEAFVDLATTSQVVNFNGNDAVALYRNGVMIDLVGIVDQVDMWGAEVTWVRNSNVASPSTTFNMTEWTEYPQNTFSYLGWHTFTGGSTDPVIMVISPNSAVTWYLEQTYNIGWSSANITGNVKIELDNNGTLETLAASTENTGSWSWTIPATQATGNQFKIKVSTIDGTVSDMSDVNFSIAVLPVTNLTSLAQLRAAAPDGTTIYQVNSDMILTYQQSYRNKKYLQDITGAIEIDDPDGIVTTAYQIGDMVPSIIGKLSVYHNLLQFTPFANFQAATSSGNYVTPAVLTINQLITVFDTYESQLVRLNDVTFLDTSTSFATGVNYTISDITGQIVFRTNFYEADYIGQPIPTGALNMLVITTQYDDTHQVTARFLADFNPTAIDDEVIPQNPVSSLRNYPNPFKPLTTIAVDVKSPQTVEVGIYNTKGQLIRTLQSASTNAGTHNLVWDSKDAAGRDVTAGIYLYKVKGGRYSSSKKMILLK